MFYIEKSAVALSNVLSIPDIWIANNDWLYHMIRKISKSKDHKMTPCVQICVYALAKDVCIMTNHT